MTKRKYNHKQPWIPPRQKNLIFRPIPQFDIGEIVIRPLNESDAFSHKQLCDVSADYLNKYLGFADDIGKWNIGHHKKWISDHQLAGYPFQAYGAFYGKHLLGFFTYGRAGDLLGTQICYYVSKDCSSRGIASEVTSVLVEKAFSLIGFDYVELHIDKHNEPSKKVAKKSGFSLVKAYQSPKIGSHGTGNMELWVNVNPSNTHGITLENFINDDYDYLIPVYQNIETALTSAHQMKIIADKIRRAKLALSGQIPLDDVQDIFDDYYQREALEGQPFAKP
jgi:RimJ/RimL family protein N-acetyltransferase